MGAVAHTEPETGDRLKAAHWVLLAGGLLATLPVFASFLPIDLGIDPRLEAIPMALHLAAGLCALGLTLVFLQMRDIALHALSHPMVLAAVFVAAWSAVVAPLTDYPWLSLIGTPAFGEAAVRYLALAVFFASALVLATHRTALTLLCMILVAVSVLAPVVMFAWGQGFFVSLDLVGYFAIPAALGAWLLSARQKLWLRALLAGAAVLPAFALSTNHSVIAVLILVAGPAAVLTHWLLSRRPDRARMIRVVGIAAVIVAPFAGLLAKWLLPDLIELPSIRSRHLLDKVLLAAILDDPLILAIGQGWGAINLTMDAFAPLSGAVMWDGSWDLAARNVSHSHSTYLEALFGAGLPAFAGYCAILAAPILVVSPARLPLAVFASVALAGMAAITGEFPSSVGAVAMSLAIAGARPPGVSARRVNRSAGRSLALSMPVLAALLLTAAFWQFHVGNTIRERVADVRATGADSAYNCNLHPHSAIYADTELPQGLIRSYRGAFKYDAAGQPVPLDDIWLIDAYACSADARIAASTSPSLLLAMEVFRVDVGLGQLTSELPRRYRWILENWDAELDRVLTLLPGRTDVAVGY